MFAPDDLGPTVRITAFTLTGLSTLVVAVRFYCRIWVVGKLKLYDYIMLVALMCTWGLCVVHHYQLLYGTGQRNRPPKLPPEPPNPERMRILLYGAARAWYSYQIMYLGDLALIKFSILAFYLSIATQRMFRRLVILSIVVVALFTILFIFLNGFECPKEPSIAVTPAIFQNRKKLKCFDLPTLYYSQAGFNIASDVVILVLPMPVLVKLRMPRLKRFALLLLFSAGVMAPVASALRIWGLYLWSTAESHARYNGGYVLFWTQVELNTAIVCASLPSLQPLFKRMFGELSRYSHRSAYYYYGGGNNTIVEAIEVPTRGTAHQESNIDPPQATYHPEKGMTHGTENGIVLVQEYSDEDEIRSRVIHFSSQRSSAHSCPPKSPQRPRDLLMSSG